MNPEEVTKTWVWYGLEDLYFGFSMEGFDPHKPYSLFFEIMGFEKILKAYLLFQNRNQYTSLGEEEAKKKIEKLVKNWGHCFRNMLKEISKHHEPGFYNKIKLQYFDGFSGHDLVRALEVGYMESRYPIHRPIYEQFKVKGVEFYRNPLKSSGISKFIFHVCREQLLCLKKYVNLNDITTQFAEVYGVQKSFSRFLNIAFDGDLNKYL